MTIGSASAKRDEKSYGFVEVSRSVAGFSIGILAVIVNGLKDGPTLVPNAAMHGTEIIGTLAISRFFRAARPESIKGIFI